MSDRGVPGRRRRPSPDRTRSLEQLEGHAWGEPAPGATHLVRSVHALRRRPLNTLTADELRRLIGQDVGVPWLLPIALEVLRAEEEAPRPDAEERWPHGDERWTDDALLGAILRQGSGTWADAPESARELCAVLEALTEVPSTLSADIEHFTAALPPGVPAPRLLPATPPPGLADWLRTNGWTPGRDAGPWIQDLIDERVRDAARQGHPLTPSPAAVRFLRSFGLLELVHPKDPERRWTVDPTAGHEGDAAGIAALAADLGRGLFPVGGDTRKAGDPRAGSSIVMDDLGRCFSHHPSGNHHLGEDAYAALAQWLAGPPVP
ncbi:contact-dependent growth inhibition system immunity protein [Streptomyces sp. I05A-00742]|uniref:contact-dependent growth inhibition system immunity protein n=1 Tax=Streptomyces sp. I05A-00742 TaxID=2732853 RepID=UPI001487E86C|nr:contact-dependent growth inhibition system immunity protein [Streptomyces sp. I05A-00742]